MKSRRIISLLAVAVLATTVFVGCGKKEAGLKDGKYNAESAADDRGYKGAIEVEVKGGKIASVKYDEANDKGSKLADEGYNKTMKEKSKTNPTEAFPKLEASLVEKQDASKVDVVTGATKSSEQFKTLAQKALEGAK